MSESSEFPENCHISISVVMPVFNGANTIREALDSIFKQTKQPDEIIVVDDGSKDNSLEIASSYGDKVIVLKQENGGNAKARNYGMKHASGDFIAVLDSDDIWREDKLEKQLEFCTEADVIYTGVKNFGNCEHVDSETFPNGECVSGDHLIPLMLDNFIAHSSVLMRRDFVLELGGYDDELKTSPDWDLWLRMANSDKKFVGIPEALTLYRWSAGSTSKNHTQTCKDRVQVIQNAIIRAESERIPKSIQKEALKNAWLVSAWFASTEQPWNAIIWYQHALRLNPFSIRTWVELARTMLNVLRSKG